VDWKNRSGLEKKGKRRFRQTRASREQAGRKSGFIRRMALHNQDVLRLRA
jgi:hypothetical protein